MSIIINREELTDALAACAAVTKSRTPQEVLKCVRITSGDKCVEFEATNLEVRVRRTARQVQVDAPGVVAVNADDALAAARVSDGDTVKITLAGDVLSLAGDSCLRKLFTQDPSNFPPAPRDEDELFKVGTTVGAAREAFGYVRHATGEETRYYAFQGFALDREGDSFRLCGADGRCLAVKPMAGTLEGEAKLVVIHRDNFATAMSAIGGEDGDELSISIAPSSILIESGDVEYWMVRLQGNFPEYRDILRVEGTGGVRASRESLERAVRQAMGAMTPEVHTMVVEASATGLRMSMRNPVAGESFANLLCRVDGNPTTFAANAPNLLECVEAMSGDEVVWSWTAPNRPFSLKCGDELEVMMPANIPA